MKATTRRLRRAAACCAALGSSATALAVGCTFPSVTFQTSLPDASTTAPVDDAGDPDVTFVDPGDTTTPDAGPNFDANLDAGPLPDGACDFQGTWGSRITIDVSWTPQGLNSVILAPGTGQIRQWIKGTRRRSDNVVSDDSVVCGIELPDFKASGFVGGETYGVRFPDATFDSPDLPHFTVGGVLGSLFPGATYGTTTTAVLLGISMAQPASDPWPDLVTAGATSVDMDQDGKPGVTVAAAQGTPYSNVPVEIPALILQQPARANRIYLAIRQVTTVNATVKSCTEMTGTVQIPQLPTASGGVKSAIDSHILGCALVDGGDCSTSSSSSPNSQASFVDNSEPVFTPSGTTDFHSLELPVGATCADVRAALP